LLRFIGAPKGLIKFNEYIYKAEAPINVDLFREVLRLNGLNDDITFYPIDSEGYPRPFANTPDMYFQNNGLWYRETGGSGSTIDILTGNNPHLGPYDGGYKYIDQFKELIPNFSPVVVSSITTTSEAQNLYTNYDSGSFDNGVTTATTVNTVSIVDENGLDFSKCVVFIPSIEPNPNPLPLLNDCGCQTPSNNNMLSLCIDKKQTSIKPKDCSDSLVGPPIDNPINGIYTFKYYQYRANGSIYPNSANPIYNTSYYTTKECCTKFKGTPFIYDTVVSGITINTGYVCCDGTNNCGCFIACKWMVDLNLILASTVTQIANGTKSLYLQFIKPDGTMAVVTPDGCNCISNYSVPVPNVVDPYTGVVGYGCQATANGINEIAKGILSQIYIFYQKRSNGLTSCKSSGLSPHN